MDLKSMKDAVNKSSLFGTKDQNGKDFDDLDEMSKNGLPFPTAIWVSKGAIIDKISLSYEGGTTAHGGKGGTGSSFTLESKEYIIKVRGNATAFNNQWVIENIAFRTNKGREFTMNTPRSGGNYFEYAVKSGKAICCMYGRAGQYLNCIGFYERDIEASSIFPQGKSFGL